MPGTDRERYASEFVGTYVLVMSVGCSVLTGSALAPLCIAAALTVLVFALGGVSGAHFNPAVTTAVLFMGIIDLQTAMIYIVMQLLAGVAGGISYLFLFGRTFNLIPKSGFTWIGAGTVEVVYTFFLVFVVLNTACTQGFSNTKAKQQFAGIAIGLSLLAGITSAGYVSGAMLNPALALGVDLASAGIGFGYCLAYMVFQLLGGVAAAGFTCVLRPSQIGDGTSGEIIHDHAKYLAEFVGLFLFAFTVGLNAIQGPDHVLGVFGIAAALVALVYAVSDVSGAHLNPAVTFALWARGQRDMDAGKVVMYWLCQFAGAGVGGLLCVGLTWKSVSVGPQPGYTWVSVVVVETIFTFVLTFVVLCVTSLSTSRNLTDFYGFAIGFSVVAGGYAVGKISGGYLNPALVVAMDLGQAAKTARFGRSIAYVLVQILGAGFAALVFATTRKHEMKGVKSFKLTW